jgi:hypothetical protein
MSRTRNRFVPRLQAFDDRSLPSVTASVVPGSSILQITGDAAANTITIQDNGQATGLVVVGDGQTFTFAQTILAIVVDTGDGNDTVGYNLLGPLTGTRSISVDLGRGADTFTANLSGQTLTALANLDISAYGRGGVDTLILNAQGVNTEANSILNVYFEGGAGKDKITLGYTPGDLAFGQVFLAKDQRN